MTDLRLDFHGFYDPLEEWPHIHTMSFDVVMTLDDGDTRVTVGDGDFLFFDCSSVEDMAMLFEEADAFGADALTYAQNLLNEWWHGDSFKPGFTVLDRIHILPVFQGQGFGARVVHMLAELSEHRSSFLAVLPVPPGRQELPTEEGEALVPRLMRFYAGVGLNRRVSNMLVRDFAVE